MTPGMLQIDALAKEVEAEGPCPDCWDEDVLIDFETWHRVTECGTCFVAWEHRLDAYKAEIEKR